MILVGDALEKLKELKDNSVDAVVTDPPYGIDFQSAWRTDRARRKPKIANDKLPFIWWLPEAFRVLKNDSAMLCFCRWDVQDDFKRAIELAGFQVKSQVIWDRGYHGMGDLSSTFGPQHDVIWFAAKGKFKFPGKRPKSVIQVNRVAAERLLHPNQKPVRLMEELITSITPPGGVVLDPFMGSGTTGIACKNLGFDFIGIEREPEYAEIAQKRLEAVL